VLTPLYCVDASQSLSQMTKHICIVGSHHHYQYRRRRIGFARAITDLIDLWRPDFIGEEFDDDIQEPSFTKMRAVASGITWENVDLKEKERPYFPDSNPLATRDRNPS
jgi:hypothetical protein